MLLVSTGDCNLSCCIVGVKLIRLGLGPDPSLCLCRLGKWLGWTSKCEALLHGTLPIFGIDVSCTCPLQHTLTWSQSSTLLVCFQQISYDVTLPSNTSSGTWLSYTGLAWLGLNINTNKGRTISNPMVQTHIPLYRRLKDVLLVIEQGAPCPPATHPSSCIYKEGLTRLGLARLGKLVRLEALLHGTVPIFGIDVSCTCPLVHWLGLAWAWLGLWNVLTHLNINTHQRHTISLK